MKLLNYALSNVDLGQDLIFAKVAEILAERLPNAVGEYGCDLHNFLFNTGESYIYTADAEKACESIGVWTAIQLVQAYDEFSFGEHFTETEPCAIANMLVYMYGEFILKQSKYLQEKAWVRNLNEQDLRIITKQIATWVYRTLPTKGKPNRIPLYVLVWDEWVTY